MRNEEEMELCIIHIMYNIHITHIHIYWKISLKMVLSTYQFLVYVFQFLLLLLLDCIKIFEKCSGKKCTIS